VLPFKELSITRNFDLSKSLAVPLEFRASLAVSSLAKVCRRVWQRRAKPYVKKRLRGKSGKIAGNANNAAILAPFASHSKTFMLAPFFFISHNIVASKRMIVSESFEL
jgi:hypothetical protein